MITKEQIKAASQQYDETFENFHPASFESGALWSATELNTQIKELKSEIERLKGLIEEAWEHGQLQRVNYRPTTFTDFKQKHGL